MSGTTIVYCVFGDEATAAAAARTVVTERLAACANILASCRSFYEWDGRLEDATEVPVLFKVRTMKRDALMARLAELHDYEVPAILAWDAELAHPPYADWLRRQTT